MALAMSWWFVDSGNYNGSGSGSSISGSGN